MGDPHTQGRIATWTVELDGSRHSVELEIGYTPGAVLVWLDGALMSSPGADGGSISFTALNRQWQLHRAGRRFRLTIDGRELSPIDSDRDMLLRPAQADDTRNLLRPAGHSPRDSSEHLLIPTDKNPTDSNH